MNISSTETPEITVEEINYSVFFVSLYIWVDFLLQIYPMIAMYIL